MGRKIPAFATTLVLALPLRALSAQAEPSVHLPDPATLPAVALPTAGAPGQTHERVRHFLAYFQGPGRNHMTRLLELSSQYQPMIRQRFAIEGLAPALAYLPLIESGYRPGAISPDDAVGLWQFIRLTGRAYGLRVDSWVDERRDPIRSTDAAARYLRDLQSRFGSPFLAAAAYNAGSAVVARGLAKLGLTTSDSGSPDPFFRLVDEDLLAQETKDYVPTLMAASMIARAPGRYGFRPAPAAHRPSQQYDSLVVIDATGLDIVARLASVRPEVIRELNPQYLRLATPPATRSVIRLPRGLGRRVQVAYDSLPPIERVRYLEHTVARGDRLESVASRYRVSADEIRAANPGVTLSPPRPGTILVIPSAAVPPDRTARAAGWRSTAAATLPARHPLDSGMRPGIPG